MTTSLIGTYTDQQAEQIALQGLLEAVCTNPLDCANSLMELWFHFEKGTLLIPTGPLDDVNATDPTAELVIGYLPRRAKMIAATYTPSTATAVTASNSAYATVILQARPGLTGVTSTLVLAQASSTLAANGGTGNWAQWTPVSLNVNAFDPTNNVLVAGSVLTAKITKTGAGVVVPGGSLDVRVQYV